MNLLAAEPRGIKRGEVECFPLTSLDFWHIALPFLPFRASQPCLWNSRLTKTRRPIIASLLQAVAWRFPWRWLIWSFALFVSDCNSEHFAPENERGQSLFRFPKTRFHSAILFQRIFLWVFHLLPSSIPPFDTSLGKRYDKARCWRCAVSEWVHSFQQYIP